MAIEEVVDVQITIQDKAVTREGFGVGLILGSSGKLTAKVEGFADMDEVDDVFASGDPEHAMATAYFGQDLKPESVLIGQRDVDQKHKVNILITALQDSSDYTLSISIDGAAAVLHSYTSDPTATRAEIVTGLIAAINGSSQAALLTLTDNGDDFDIESAVAGDGLSITPSVNMTVQLLTANRNIETELAAIEELNNDWYCLLSASHLDKDIKRGANFVQTRRKIYLASSQNADIISPERHIFTLDFDADFVASNLIDLDIDTIPVTQTPWNATHTTTLNDLAVNIQAHPRVSTATVTGARQITVTAEPYDVLLVVENILVTGGVSQANGTTTTTVDPTTDLGAELKALTLDRTGLIYLATADTEYPEAALAGGQLPQDPGSITWAFKTLTLVTIDELTSAQKSKALGNNVNTYTEVGGIGITQNGTMASGRFIDIRRGVDWIEARMEENIFFQVANLPKIPYTDSGIAIIENEMREVLNDGIDKNVIAADPPFEIETPLATDVAANDRVNRLLPDVTFDARMAGAIHKVEIQGVVSI